MGSGPSPGFGLGGGDGGKLNLFPMFKESSRAKANYLNFRGVAARSKNFHSFFYAFLFENK